MRIHNGGQPIQPHINLKNQASNPSHGKNVAQTGDSESLVRSTAADQLVSSLVTAQDVRESLVNELKIKIQSGEFLSQQSALETADAILNL